MGAIRTGKHTVIESRRAIDWTNKLPEVAAAVSALSCHSAVIDGEVVILLPEGRSSFQHLQNVFSEGASRAGLTYYVFDLLELEGRSLTKLSLLQRKELLAQLVKEGPPLIQYSQHLEGDGALVLANADRLGLEGIVSKRRNAPHRAGRSDGWLKTKCTKVAEFVIGGFSEPEGARSGVGALLIGVYEDDALVFSGGVGTGRGWTAEFLLELRRALDGLEQPECPFVVPPPAEYLRGAHWVRPVLVCELAFAEWTDDGTLRHASFQGFKPGVDATSVRAQHKRSVLSTV
jgi:bifunctional non-homologous end joining protein LigD